MSTKKQKRAKKQERLEAEAASLSDLLQIKDEKSIIRLRYTKKRTNCSELIDEGGDHRLIREANADAKEAFEQYAACLISIQRYHTETGNGAGHDQATAELNDAEKDFAELSRQYRESAIEERSNHSSVARSKIDEKMVGREQAPSECTQQLVNSLRLKDEKSIDRVKYTQARTNCAELIDEGAALRLIRAANMEAKETFEQYISTLTAMQQTHTGDCDEAGHERVTQELERAEKDFAELSTQYRECALEERSLQSSQNRRNRPQMAEKRWGWR